MFNTYKNSKTTLLIKKIALLNSYVFSDIGYVFTIFLLISRGRSHQQQLVNYKKLSLQTFQKYLSYKKDHSELLYYILRQLTMDQLAYMRGLHNHSQSTIEISERDLTERARQINITDLKPFYDSRIFKINNFSYDQKRKVIIHILPEAPSAT